VAGSTLPFLSESQECERQEDSSRAIVPIIPR
jgi:hypothetical protein